MKNFKEHIRNLETNILNDLLKQYMWETECNIANHSKNILSIKEELKMRIKKTRERD